MLIPKVSPVQQIKDKQSTNQQSIQLKKQHTGGTDFAKILAAQIK